MARRPVGIDEGGAEHGEGRQHKPKIKDVSIGHGEYSPLCKTSIPIRVRRALT